MAASTRNRRVNPRLATYLAIFFAAYVASGLMSLIFAELNVLASHLRTLQILVPIAILTLVGIASYASEPSAYFVAQRSIPPFFNGLGLAVTVFGAAGLSGLAGTIFILGMDGLLIGFGLLLGVMALAIAIAPFLRKDGAYTVADYLGRRFESRAVRVTAALLLAIPLLMLAIAELQIAGWLLSRTIGGEAAGRATMLGLAAMIVVSIGGMRALMWLAAAAGTLAIVSVTLPISIVSVLKTNLPFPPLTYGLLLEDVARGEVLSGLADRAAPGLAIDLPPASPSELARPFLSSFASIGPVSFVALAISMMAGIATLPSLLARNSASASIYDARKAMGWTVFLVGAALLFLPALAVFLRHMTLETGLFLDRGDTAWLSAMVPYGLAPTSADAGSGTIFRDATLLALPAVAGLPGTVFDLAAAGIIAMAFVTFGAHVLALGSSLADDVVLALFRDPPDLWRSIAARIGAAAAAVCAILLASASSSADPFRLMLNALAIGGGTAFSVIVMSIWWKRITAVAAFWAMVVGFGVSASYALLADGIGLGPFLGLEPMAMGSVATLISAGIAASITSASTAPPPQSQRDMVRDLRIPSGETLYDRELRLREAERLRRARR